MARFNRLLTIAGLLAIVVGFAVTSTGRSALPDEEPASPPPPPRPILRLLVPRDELSGILSRRQTPGRLIPVKELKDLLDGDRRRKMEATEEARRKGREERNRFPRDLVVKGLKAKVVVSPDGRLARVSTTYSIDLPNASRQAFVVPSKGLVAEGARLDDADALLEPRGEELAVTMEGGGSHLFTLDAVAGVTTEGYSQIVQIPLAPFTAGSVTLEIPGDDLSVRVEPGIDPTVSRTKGTTRILASLAGGSSLKITWYTVGRHHVDRDRTSASGTGAAAQPSGGAEKSETPRRTPFVTVESCHVAGVSDSGLVGLVEYRYSVRRAPLAEAVVRLPSDVGPVEVLARADLFSQKVDDGRTLRLVLTNPQEGDLEFALRYKKEAPRQTASTARETKFEVSLPDLEPAGVAAEAGYVIVSRLATVQIDPKPGNGLEPIDESALPAPFGRHRSIDSLYLYRHLAHPARLDLAVTRYGSAEPLIGVVDQATVTTVFSRNRGRITSIDYAVRGERLELLRLKLPERSVPERITVDDQAVSPREAKDKAILVPLRSRGRARGPVANVRVVFRTPGEPATPGQMLEAELPAVDLPTLRVCWCWVVPDELTLVRFSSKARVLRGSRQRPAVFADSAPPIPIDSGYRRYHITEGLIEKDGQSVVNALSLSAGGRFVPMVALFLLGAASIYLALRFLFYGCSPRITLLVLALSHVGLELLKEEEEISRPFRGGYDLMSWLIVAVVAFRIARSVRRYNGPEIPVALTDSQGGEAR